MEQAQMQSQQQAPNQTQASTYSASNRHAQWQSLLTLGNECFHAKQWSQAEFFYSEAYDLLAFAYRNDPLSLEFLMAWVGACHNLSALYEVLGNLHLSLKFLMVPHEYLKDITESKKAHDEVKLIALNGMRLTVNPILAFTKKHKLCEDCKAQFPTLKLLTKHNAGYAH